MAKSGVEKMSMYDIIQEVGTIIDDSYLSYILKKHEDMIDLRAKNACRHQ